MPSSAVRTFTDADNYTASIRRTTAEVTITGQGHFAAKLVRIDLPHLWLQRFTDNLPRIAYSTDEPGYATISLRTQPGPSLRRNGVEMLPSSIIRRGHAETYFQQSDGLASFGSMSLSVADLFSVGAAVVGCDLTPPKDAVAVTPSSVAINKLQRLHAVAGELAENAPAVLAHPEAARGLEQALIDALITCLGGENVHEDRAALRHHASIMRKFYRAIEARPGEAVYVPELCTSIGVSERTLRVCCHEQLGLGPKRYLVLRRLHLARQALRSSSPTRTTVTEIATRYGFWQFGRFAGEYKALFGELPSAMLARPPEG